MAQKKLLREGKDPSAERRTVVTALTMKQRLFVAEYLRDLNATAAAVRAGYSRRTARQMAAENLTKPDIAQAIAEAMERRAEAAHIDAVRIVQELGRVGFSNIADLFDDAGRLKPLEIVAPMQH